MKLLAEHEMGELFKVIGFATPGHPGGAGLCGGRPQPPALSEADE
jgi:hypothetical protein